MPKLKKIACALTIAGSDSGGGAGIQADLKTFASLEVHGCSAITCLTAQNPREVTGIQAATPEMVRQQIEAVFAELHPKAIKTGMLFSAPIIEQVAALMGKRRRPNLVVDPVMVATSGARLLKPAAVKVLTRQLLPVASLITPNLDEAVILVGKPLQTVEDLRFAARDLYETYGCAALVKGGHLRGMDDAVDVFFDGKDELLLKARFITGVSTHGTGCTYSAAITGYLARGCSLPEAVQSAKRYISRAIATSRAVARHTVLNSFWKTASEREA